MSNVVSLLWDPLFSTYAEFSEKITFFTLWYLHIHTYALQGEGNSSFWEDFVHTKTFNEHSSRSLTTIQSGAKGVETLYYQFMSAAREYTIVKIRFELRNQLSQTLSKSLKNTNLIWALQRHSREQNLFRLRI